MVNATTPTPYPQINALLGHLLIEAQRVLGEGFVGLYLHGSLACGGFNPETSDIDFLVVTEGPLPAGTFSALKVMHACLSGSGRAWSQKIEGAYVPEGALRRHEPAHPPIPWLGLDGHFALETLGSDWILQRWILREKGIVIAGPPVKPLIDPVCPDDLREAVRGNLREWWSPPFPSPERFESHGYRAYAVLTICRSLFLLAHGTPSSKPEAADWAMRKLGNRWNRLVEAALQWRPGMQFDPSQETFDLILFTLGEFRLPLEADRNSRA